MTTRGRPALAIFFALTLSWLGGGAVYPALGQTPPAGQIIVKDLAVQGNRRVQEAVILGRASAKVGSPFVPARLADDIRAIFALGFFDDVQAKIEDFEGGVKLTFVVTERPFVRDINFAGSTSSTPVTVTGELNTFTSRLILRGTLRSRSVSTMRVLRVQVNQDDEWSR